MTGYRVEGRCDRLQGGGPGVTGYRVEGPVLQAIGWRAGVTGYRVEGRCDRLCQLTRSVLKGPLCQKNAFPVNIKRQRLAIYSQRPAGTLSKWHLNTTALLLNQAPVTVLFPT